MDGVSGRLSAQESGTVISLSPVRVVEGNSGIGTARIPVYLSAAASAPVTVQWTTADGTASTGSDYTTASGTLTFAPGETFQTISLQISGDTTDEYDEAFTVEFFNPAGASLGDTKATVKIREDEPLTIPLLPLPVNIFENQKTDLPALTVVNPVIGRSVKLAVTGGTATMGTDITLTGADMALSSARVPLPLTVTDDDQPEADETFSLALGNPGPGVKLPPNSLTQMLPSSPPPMDMAVQDDLLVMVDGTDLRIFRQSGGTWNLEQTVAGAAEGGVSGVALDQGFIAADFRNTGVKIFTWTGSVWVTQKSISLPPSVVGVTRPLVLQDDLLAIGDPVTAGAAGQSGKVRLHERHLGGRDAWGERQILIPPVPEPDFGSSLSLWGDHLVVGAPGAFAVSFFKRGAETRHWVLLREFVRFSPGFGKACAVDGNRMVIAPLPLLLTSERLDSSGDAWSEPVAQNTGVSTDDPQVALNGGILCIKYGGMGVRYFRGNAAGTWDTLERSLPILTTLPVPRRFAWDGKTTVLTGNGDPAAAPLLIYSIAAVPGLLIDDETVRFTVDDVLADETQTFTTVRLSRPLPVKVAVKYTLLDGTAVVGEDYAAALQSTVSFEAGQTTAYLRVFPRQPLPDEGQKNFYIQLDPYLLGTAGPNATVTIGGQPELPLLSMVTSSQAVAEGDSGAKAVAIGYQLSAAAPAGASFSWSTQTDVSTDTAVAGSDFTADSGVVPVPEGATNGSFNVTVLGDTVGEWEEKFSVVLGTPVKLTLNSYRNRTAVSITNDDTGTPVNDNYSIAQGGVLSGVDVRLNDTGIQEVETEVSHSGRTLLYNGLLTYTPLPNFIGQYSFPYRDRFQVPEVPARFATVTVTVSDAHLPPVVLPQYIGIKEDTASTGNTTLLTASGVLNAQSVAYDPILEVGISDVINGTVTNANPLDGRLIFTPATDFSGNAGFRYRLRDKDGWSNFAQVRVSVSDDLPLPPFQRLNPAGSQLFRSISGPVTFPGAGEVDYPLELKAGQTLSLRVNDSSGPLGRLELRDASGKAISGGAAGVNSLENIPIPSDGVYKIFAGDRGTAGSGTLTVLVNGGLPLSLNNAAGACSLDATKPAGCGRAAVAATLSAGTHYYSFAGVAGETVQLYLQSSSLLTFTLQQPAGAILASSSVNPSEPSACILNFTLPAAGTFLVVVKRTSGTADYTLQLYRGTEIHDFSVPPWSLSSRGSGFLSGRGVLETGTPEPMVTFAAFGDYGSGSANEAAVAAMVKSWNPDFIAAVGDHNYLLDYTVGTPTWKATVGDFYGSFIKGRIDNRYPEQTSAIQRFFPTPGNHDTGPDPGNGGELASYFDYFHSNPGGTLRLPEGVHQPQLSYYKVSWGNTELFFVDSDHAVIDPIVRAAERQWLKDQIRSSTARWKIAIWHHPAYSSSSVHGSNFSMQWGADLEGLAAVITGHVHTYERVDAGFGVTQFVAGVGGNSFYGFPTNPLSNSLFRNNTNHGALKVVAGTQGIRFEFRAVGPPEGKILDSHTIGLPPGPVVPSGSDTWSLRVQPGQILKLATRTPQPPGTLTNSVNPMIQLLDASGAVVASDAGSAPDGVNAALTHTVPAIADLPPEGALWSVRVANESAASGEYELSISQAGDNPYGDWAAANLPSLPAGAQDDPDRDGAPNLMEFLAGSDPRIPGSVPPLTPVSSSAGGRQIQLNLPADWTVPVSAGLQTSASLAGDSWTTVATKNPGDAWTSPDGGAVPLAVPDGGFLFTLPSGQRQFYRLIFSSL